MPPNGQGAARQAPSLLQSDASLASQARSATIRGTILASSLIGDWLAAKTQVDASDSGTRGSCASYLVETLLSVL